ncbi:MAG: hypothetical protein IJ192_13110 [Clostridia bacterium]|nr:hypothetical protein [Clostridia bacterium]
MRIRLKNFTVEVSFPLIAVMTAVILYDSGMTAAVCLIAILLHEGGHLLVLWYFGSFPKKIRITLFDIAIVDRSKALMDTKKELAVVLAGVTSNFIFAAVSYLLYIITGQTFFSGLINANLTLAVFNSLPADSLDGGQALYILLCRHFPVSKAIFLLDIISFVVLIPTACLGFLVLLQSKYNFTLLLTSVYLMAAILIRNKKV